MTAKLKKELRKIVIAAVLFAVLMLLDKTGECPAVFEHRWLSLGLYLIPYLICGYPVLREAVLGVVHGQMMDEAFLMAIASVGAMVTGETEEAAAVMLFYQVGEWFQRYAVGRSRKSISDLMDIVPEEAGLEQEDGSVRRVEPEEVKAGDVLVVRPGEKIPVDGEVLTGESLVNTAALTGEPMPRSVRPGSQVISGCVNGDGLLRVRAQKAYEDSTVARILELVENASDKKSRTENFITRFARWYTPVVVAMALALALIPSLVSGDWMRWIYRACTFLVISCPCALVISVPLSFFGGIGAASRNGVLVKGSNYLELLARIDTVVSDKTGTLTEGNFKVSGAIPAKGVTREELLRTAALAEGMSTHPIALSIREYLREQDISPEEAKVLSVDNVPGEGLTAKTASHLIRVGSGRMMERAHIAYQAAHDAAATVCYVARDETFLGVILIRDTVKKGAAWAIREMKREGVRRVVMLTGDRQSVGEAVAAQLGVDSVYAQLMPQDKVERVEELLKEKKAGSYLAFIGDGINDAPVLTRSDVGIAMGSLGSDAAIEAADVVIMDDDLARIPLVIRIARRTVGIAAANIVFALIVKVLILILGALGYADMWAAVFADVGVAVLCILNAMRLLAVRRTI